MLRLDTLAPDIVARLRSAGENRQRKAALAACEYAVRQSDLNDPLVVDALQAIEGGRQISPESINGLRQLARQLDEEYLDLQGVCSMNCRSTSNFMTAFSKARSVDAILSAAGEDAFAASVEAIYEAAATADDVTPLFKSIKEVLDRT